MIKISYLIYWAQWDSLHINNEILYRILKSVDGSCSKFAMEDSDQGSGGVIW